MFLVMLLGTLVHGVTYMPKRLRERLARQRSAAAEAKSTAPKTNRKLPARAPPRVCDRSNICVIKGKELEDAFTKKVNALFRRKKRRNREFKAPSAELFNQEWESKDGFSTDGKPYSERPIRVVQFNILAHGLSGDGCGFAGSYDYNKEYEGITNYMASEAYKKAIQKGKDVLLEAKNGTEDEKTQAKESATKHMNGALECLESLSYRSLLMSDCNQKSTKNEQMKICTGVTITNPENDKEIKNTHTVEILLKPFPERHRRVIGLILKQNPDVITLQECDRFDDFLDILKPLGFDGRIQRKPTLKKGSPCAKNNAVCDKKNKKFGVDDGCAIFWNRSRLQFVAEHGGQFKDDKGDLAKQVYLTVKLKNIRTKQEFMVVSAHLKSGKPVETPVKKAQAKEIGEILKNIKDAEKIPIVFGLDFNTSADNPDGVIREFHRAYGAFLQSAYVLDFNSKSTRFTAVKQRYGGEQPNKVDNRPEKHTIDFIFHDPAIKCVATLRVPEFKVVKNGSKMNGKPIYLPCWKYPSDHFMIGADLDFSGITA